MTAYVGNAFSLSMLELNENESAKINVVRISEQSAKFFVEQNKNFVSYVGHESTAEFLSERLGIRIPANRVSVKLKRGDIVLVAQIMQRLPEGKVLSREELEKVPVAWFLVTVL